MLEKEPEDAFLQYALATEYSASEKLDLALNIFVRLKNSQPEYVATYYHLGKLYERLAKRDQAEEVYEQGIVVATEQKDQHAKAELNDALNNLLFED